MINDTLAKIEAQLQASESIRPERRDELIKLLATLREEIAELGTANDEKALSIAGFAQLSAHEAMRAERNPELLKLSLRGLSSSVRGFEETHPRLVQIVNTISHTLANLGI